MSKFTPEQADDFTSKYTILAQYQNDPLKAGGTGFSATLFRDNNGALTLSFRSTEFIDDEVRDSKSTNDLEIGSQGWALGQISEMEAWYNQLVNDPRYLGDGRGGVRPFSVTGYSLGGHLADAFNILRREQVQSPYNKPNPIVATYTFNGAGTGELPNGSTLTQMLSAFNRIRADLYNSPEYKSLDAAELAYYSAKAHSAVSSIESDQLYLSRLSGVQNTSFQNSTAPVGIQDNYEYQFAMLLAEAGE